MDQDHKMMNYLYKRFNREKTDMRTQISIGVLSLMLPVLALHPAQPDVEKEQGQDSLYDVAFAITGMT